VQRGLVGANSDQTFDADGGFRWRLSIDLDLEDYRALGEPARRKRVETHLYEAFSTTLQRRNPKPTISRVLVLPRFDPLGVASELVDPNGVPVKNDLVSLLQKGLGITHSTKESAASSGVWVSPMARTSLRLGAAGDATGG
jgi:hypothetical protein